MYLLIIEYFNRKKSFPFYLIIITIVYFYYIIITLLHTYLQ